MLPLPPPRLPLRLCPPTYVFPRQKKKPIEIYRDGEARGVDCSLYVQGTDDAAATDKSAEKGAKKPAAPRERKQRGPPEDGVPSKTKVMVANLPYDLTEEKVRNMNFFVGNFKTMNALLTFNSSSRRSSRPMSLPPPRSLSARFLDS